MPVQVELDPQVADQIQRKVEAGLYPDAAAVVREAMRVLDEHEALQRLRAAVAKGERGDGIPFTPELVAQMKREAERMAREGRRPNPDVLP
jgi:putative addiction module CopG family antidote